jgi:hypothetical protein
VGWVTEIIYKVIYMSVLKRKRNISKMEFYHNALKLRIIITEFLLKDFGNRSRRRNLEFARDVYDVEEMI